VKNNKNLSVKFFFEKSQKFEGNFLASAISLNKSQINFLSQNFQKAYLRKATDVSKFKRLTYHIFWSQNKHIAL